MKMINKLAVTALGLGGMFLLPGWAMAACTLTSAAGTGSISFGRVVVQRDAPVGTILATQSIVSSGAAWRCDTSYVYTGNLTLFSTPSPYGSQVYSTNIAGVGMRVHFGSGFNMNLPIRTVAAPSTSYHAGTLAAYLIKTSAGAVGSGNLTNGKLVTFNVEAAPVYTLNLTGTNTIVPVACSVTNTSITVPMGDVPRNSFTGVGHQGPAIPFFIALNCSAGTNVKFSIDATADSSGTPGLIALDSAGTAGVASGVGIQLTNNGTPVAFRSIIPVMTAPGGTLNIPLIARYYQKSATVTAGQANAHATFTMTYN